MTPDTTTFIIKTVNYCNLACKYCYACYQDPTEKYVINGRTLSNLFEGIAQLPLNRLQIIWHGGEPLLAGREFFENALELENKFKRKDQVIINCIQTNGTLLTDEWIRFLVSNEIGIGVSIDGPDFLHDNQRVFKNNKPSHEPTLRGIHLMQQYKLPVNACLVLTRFGTNCAKEIYNFFKDNEIYEYDILPCLPYQQNKTSQNLAIEPLEYSKFLCDLFDIWFHEDDDRIQIRYLTNVIESLLTGYSTLCKLSGSCKSFISVDTDGSVYPCDSYIGIDEFKLGNLENEGLFSILRGETYRLFIQKIAINSENCRACTWFSICHGGCSFHQYLSQKSPSSKNFSCLCNRSVFQHVKEVISGYKPAENGIV